jgi:hypothetical protein
VDSEQYFSIYYGSTDYDGTTEFHQFGRLRILYEQPVCAALLNEFGSFIEGYALFTRTRFLPCFTALLVKAEVE